MGPTIPPTEPPTEATTTTTAPPLYVFLSNFARIRLMEENGDDSGYCIWRRGMDHNLGGYSLAIKTCGTGGTKNRFTFNQNGVISGKDCTFFVKNFNGDPMVICVHEDQNQASEFHYDTATGELSTQFNGQKLCLEPECIKSNADLVLTACDGAKFGGRLR